MKFKKIIKKQNKIKKIFKMSLNVIAEYEEKLKTETRPKKIRKYESRIKKTKNDFDYYLDQLNIYRDKLDQKGRNK